MENQMPVEPQEVNRPKSTIMGRRTSHSRPTFMFMAYLVWPVPW